ncbi:MAG TPA: hypothetical protein VIK01_21070 [Polyangiaceae bacterium]
MSEPIRWRDANGAAPFGARELLDAAAPLAPLSKAARERLALGVARVPTLPKLSFWAPLSTKLVAGVATALVLGAAVHFAAQPKHSVAPSLPVSTPLASVAAPPEPTPAASKAPPEPAAARPFHPAAAAVKPPDLSEAAYLERARGLLATQPAQALALASAHRRAFPQGGLRAEADVIAAQALVRLGRPQAAAARAKASLKRAPNSIYSEQLQHVVGDGS